MNEIQKAQKLYTVILNDGIEILVTEDIADQIKIDLQTENFIEINGNLYSRYEIKRIIEKKIKSSKGYRYVCDYGTRHDMNGVNGYEPCDCYSKFGVEYWKFYDWLTDRGYKFEYPSDIQKSWQELFLKQKYEQRN